MTDFREMTAEAALAALDRLTGRRRRKTALRLLYKKRARPRDLRAQLALMRALSDWPELTRFDRIYALVASTHKALELVDREAVRTLLPKLEDAFRWALPLRERNVLRMDGVHLRFSLLNVLINGSLLTGDPAARHHAQAALDAMDGINLRRVSPYLYNSSSNIVKTVGLAVVLVPDDLPRRAAQVQNLLGYGLRLRGTREPLLALTRRFGPGRLDKAMAEAAFLEFEESCARALAIREAARADAGPARRAVLLRVAESCVGQASAAQKAALLQAVRVLTEDPPEDLRDGAGLPG